MANSAIRAFIAVNISEEIHNNLAKLIKELKERLCQSPVRWVPVENIHLTIKFLGDVSVSNLDLLNKILAAEAKQHSPFEFSVGKLGAFPSKRRPRVIWVGVEAPSELLDLQRGIENETTRLGYSRENRPFSAHLTLGRVSRKVNSQEIQVIGDVLCNCKVSYLGSACVQEIHLYKSDLHPSGASYRTLYSAPLVLET